MKKKVLRIIARLNIGGPAQHVVFLSEGLSDSFETLLVSGCPDVSEGNMEYILGHRSINYKVIKELVRRINPLLDFMAFMKLLRIIFEFQPDIIHTHTAKAGTLGRISGLVYRIIKKRNVIIIHTLHGHVLNGYFSKVLNKCFIAIERVLSTFTDIIITVSMSVRIDLLRYKIAIPQKIKAINLGLDLTKFLEIELQAGQRLNEKQQLNIGIIGRLVPIKNHRMFIDFAKILIEKNNYRKFKFFVIGNGELRHDLENYVKELFLSDQIIFSGWQKELKNIYEELDLVCITSLNEGTPVSIIEAMASGRPVVATDVGGVRDLISPVCNVVGIDPDKVLIESNNRDKFAEAVNFLLNNEEAYSKLAKAGREYTKKTFSKERLIRDMELLYNDTLQKGSAI